MTLRDARPDDVDRIAEIWLLGWRDGHLGPVPEGLVEARTAESFRVRAAERIPDAAVAVVDGAIAGFVVVVGGEVEQFYVSAAHRGNGVAGALLDEAERGIAAGGHAEAWLARSSRGTRAPSPSTRSPAGATRGCSTTPPSRRGGTIAVPCLRYVKAVPG